MAKKKRAGCSAKKDITLRNSRGKIIAEFRGRQGLSCPKRKNPPKGKTPGRLRDFAAEMEHASPKCFKGVKSGRKTLRAARSCVGKAVRAIMSAR